MENQEQKIQNLSKHQTDMYLDSQLWRGKNMVEKKIFKEKMIRVFQN